MAPPPPTITHAAPLSPPTAAQMPLAALLSALGFTLADLLCRSPLVAPRVSRAFARARRGEEKSGSENESGGGGGGGTEKKGSDAAACGDGSGRVRRRKEQSLAAVVEDAGIKLVGTLHVLLCLPLAVAVLSDKRRRSSSLSSSSSSSLSLNIDSSDSDPRLLLYSSTPASRLLVSLSSGYFLWDIASILIRTYVSMTPRGKREGRSVGGGFLAHGAVCCCLFGLGALTGNLSYFAATFLLFEASTPFVYLRWALSAAGGERGKKSRAYTLCGLAMVSSFFVARIVFGLKFALEFWSSCLAEMREPLPLLPLSSSSSSGLPGSVVVVGGGEKGLEGGGGGKNIPALALALCLAANVAMNSLNLFWFSKMLSGAVKHFGVPSKKKKEATTAAEAVTMTTATATTARAVSQKEEESKATATATATAAATSNALNRRRVFSVRSTSSGIEASEGGKAAAVLAPLTPERRAAA